METYLGWWWWGGWGGSIAMPMRSIGLSYAGVGRGGYCEAIANLILQAS